MRETLLVCVCFLVVSPCFFVIQRFMVTQNLTSLWVMTSITIKYGCCHAESLKPLFLGGGGVRIGSVVYFVQLNFQGFYTISDFPSFFQCSVVLGKLLLVRVSWWWCWKHRMNSDPRTPSQLVQNPPIHCSSGHLIVYSISASLMPLHLRPKKKKPSETWVVVNRYPTINKDLIMIQLQLQFIVLYFTTCRLS